MDKILTLHEAISLGYNDEYYHYQWDKSIIFTSPELVDIEDMLAGCIFEMYAGIIERLNLLEQIKKFDYDIDNDLILVHLNDETKIFFPLTKVDIKNYTYHSLMAVNGAVELIKRYDKKRFKRKLLSTPKRIWYYILQLRIKEIITSPLDPIELTPELKEYYKSLERLDTQEGVQTDRHYYKLTENEQIAEDLFNLGFNAIQYMGLSNIKYIKCLWDDDAISDYEYQLYAVLNDGREIELYLSDSNKEYDEERHMEIDAFMYKNNKKKRKQIISDIVEIESIKFFEKEDCIFKTDKVEM